MNIFWYIFEHARNTNRAKYNFIVLLEDDQQQLCQIWHVQCAMHCMIIMDIIGRRVEINESLKTAKTMSKRERQIGFFKLQPPPPPSPTVPHYQHHRQNTKKQRGATPIFFWTTWFGAPRGLVQDLSPRQTMWFSFSDFLADLFHFCKIVQYSEHMWMRSSRVVRASDCQCRSRNSPGLNPSILRHSGIWGASDEAVLNKVHIKK